MAYWDTEEQKRAIVNVVNNTCQFPITSQNVCCEKGVTHYFVCTEVQSWSRNVAGLAGSRGKHLAC